MDAHAHLLSLGWAGPGHALDAQPYKQKGHRGLAYDPKQVRSTGNGLVKPLLVSQRHGRLGVGKKAHEPQAGNEWWLKGFESALGNIGKSESERTSGTATPELSGHGSKHHGLYSFFIKGQNMEGTINDQQEPKSRKRKSDAMNGSASSTSDDGSITAKSKTAADFEQVAAFIAARDKDEKRIRSKEQQSAAKEFAQIQDFFAAGTNKTRSQRRPGREELLQPKDGPNHSPQIETEEERRERRRRRKQERQTRAAIEGPEGSTDVMEHAIEDATAKTARKSERKRQKEKATRAAR